MDRMEAIHQLFRMIDDVDTNLRTLITNHGSNTNVHNINRTATLVIAASDSPAILKAQADYTCTGTNDETIINNAIAELTLGGLLYLHPGNFYIGSPILISKTITLQGSGVGTASAPTAISGSSIQLHAGSNCDMIQVDGNGTIIQFPQLRDFRLNGRKSVQTSGNGIHFIADLSDCMVENLFIYDCKESGIKGAAGWYMHYNNIWSEYNDKHGFELTEGWLTGCISSENTQCGIFCDPGAIHVVNTRIKNNGYHGIEIKGWTSRDCTIVGNEVQYNSYGNSGLYDGISMTGGHATQFRSVIVANNDIGSVYGTTQRYGIHLDFGNGIGIYGNVIYPEDTGTILNNAVGIDNQIRNNAGYITENSGTATLVNGTTSIVVTHSLAVTPVAGNIIITPMEAWGNMTQFYIDTYTATQFTINADINPGQDVDFAWKAIIV